MFSTRRRRGLAWGILAMLSVGLCLLALYAILTTRQLVGAMRETQRGNVTTLHVVRDCTTPGQPCYERSQKQTAGAVAAINKITVYAAACADRPGDQTVPQIQSCVIRKLAADDRRTP